MIRMAKAADVPAIRELAQICITAGIPATREATPAQVQAYAAECYEDMEDMLRQSGFIILVEETHGEITGYLMLDFSHVEPSTGEKQCFIVDLAVHPGKRGRFTTHRLIKKASALARARGLKYLVGMVSSSNDRTLQLGMKGLDFQVERVQVMRRTDID
ncbi:MAG: GNAT family N-acetyltransferase [Candidatus Eremiobacteraeota bacterium]|nr:GNAT family N-acetyltransferase [Candidatus Eremiobacteraeota bacterium]MCW5871917.1 GNAT family N-acetyltransferase [Candidatus Eremiobacteraeota bacterium]